jgi:hypothetical protein
MDFNKSDLLKQIFEKDYDFIYRFDSVRPESESNLLEGEKETFEYKFKLKKISKEFLQRFLAFETIGYTSIVLNPTALKTFNELLSGFVKDVQVFKVTTRIDDNNSGENQENNSNIEEKVDMNYDYSNIFELFERYVLYQSLTAKIKTELALIKKK